MNYLIVGSGLFGSTFAYEAAKRKNHITVIEKRNTLDTNFFPELVVSLNSLIHYSKQKLNIYIICDDITREMKEKLLKLRSITISIFFYQRPKFP